MVDRVAVWDTLQKGHLFWHAHTRLSLSRCDPRSVVYTTFILRRHFDLLYVIRVYTYIYAWVLRGTREHKNKKKLPIWRDLTWFPRTKVIRVLTLGRYCVHELDDIRTQITIINTRAPPDRVYTHTRAHVCVSKSGQVGRRSGGRGEDERVDCENFPLEYKWKKKGKTSFIVSDFFLRPPIELCAEMK